MAASAQRDPAIDLERRRTREFARLQSQNTQLRIDSRRYQLLRRAQRNAPAARGVLATPLPYQLVDPRRVPVEGTRVLPPLSPPLSLGIRMGAAIGAELRAMAIETRALLKALAASHAAAEELSQSQGAMDAPPDGNTVSGRAQLRLAALQARWNARFDALAQTWAPRLVTDVTAQSTAQMAHGLKDVASLQEIQSTLQTPRMRALVQAATETSVGLITRIPQRFLGDVRTQVMSAITTGSGLEKLVPYLTKRYKGDARHAHLVALDQIRKVSESVNAARLQSLGVEEYTWLATGGERYPRKLHHQHLNGKTFRYDDPPVIDEKTGERGIPGQLVNCRCRQRPVINFTRMAA